VVEHHEGSTFREVSEEVLEKDAGTSIQLKNNKNFTFEIISNNLTGIQEEIIFSKV